MKTPSIYNKNLKNGCVNYEMLGACIYSFNKRAKNFRDKIRDLVQRKRYANWWEREYIQQSIDSATEKRDEYYRYKDYFLSLISPSEIHKVTRWNERWNEVYVEYYLYYKVLGYSFHHPIKESEIANYGLQVVELPTDFITDGADISDLISVQFAKKVYEDLKKGELQIIDSLQEVA